jgi:hypothetical protein
MGVLYGPCAYSQINDTPMTDSRGRSGRLPITSLPMLLKPLAGEALGF